MLSELSQISSDGLAVLDEEFRFLAVNRAGCEILGLPEPELLGQYSPFACGAATLEGSVREGPTRASTTWHKAVGGQRELEFRLIPTYVGGQRRIAVSFGDLTESRLQRRRLAAIARAASSVAAAGSLRATLDAVAAEVVMVGGMAAVQILTLDAWSGDVRVVGQAGFADRADFADRLADVVHRGGQLRMVEALKTRAPVIDLHRKASVMADLAWAPLHDLMGVPDWDSFVSVPLLIRDRALGVLNAFYAPGRDPEPNTIEFLEAMAEQAAVAVDYAALLSESKFQARLQERQRLARDLHDSVVQHVFSIRMQAKALSALIDRDKVDLQKTRTIAAELLDLSQDALADLRRLVFESQPAELDNRGLTEAVRLYAATVSARTGLQIAVNAGWRFPDLSAEAHVDVYRVIQEAVQNVVKHAGASNVEIRFSETGPAGETLFVDIEDDGRGIDRSETRADGFGFVSMQQRAERWGGSVEVRPRRPHGTQVHLTVTRVPMVRGGAHESR